jgi:hypothetical protein
MKTDDLLKKAGPRPWRVGGKNGVIVYAADGHAIADTQVFHEHHEAEQEEHSELIVRAVNSFEAMRDALKALYEHCEMVHRHWGENYNREQAEAARKAGRAALALAEGKAVQS